MVMAMFCSPLLAELGTLTAWAAQNSEPLLMRLSPQNRAIVLMALLALVLVGLGLVTLAILGRHHVLRLARKSHGPTPRYEDQWYRKPLVPREPEAPPQEDR
jgi:hypothetical protein